MSRYQVEVVDRVSRLKTLVESWTELWACARFSTPFQHPTWILAFYEELCIQAPRILVAWRGQQLAMMAPFYLWRTHARSTLVLAGNGVSDYLDVLVRPESESCAGEALRVFTTESEWDVADLRDLDSPASLCLMPWPAAAGDTTLPEEGCPRLALSGQPKDPLASVSKALRRDLGRAERKLTDAGNLEVAAANPATLRTDYDQLVSLHTARWQNSGAAGIFSTDYHRRFFLAAFTGLARAGLLRLFTVRLNGKPIAATCGFFHRCHYYHFITGYDPEWAHLSLGSLVVYVALRAAISEGAVCFDFLRGKEAYKYRWGARDHQTYRRLVRPMRS